MNTKIMNFFLIIVGLLTANIYAARVLVVVEYNYLRGGYSTYIDRYLKDMKNIDNIDTEQVTFDNVYEETNYSSCVRLWTLIRDKYATYQSTNNKLEGVVLVGQLPIAFGWDPEISRMITNDYFFMDVWNSTTSPQRKYNDFSEVWTPFRNYDNMLYVYLEQTLGDKKLDIWVSRIFASSITGPVIGKEGYQIDNYQIINEYFDRLHDRMTVSAKVPPRAMCMGHIAEWGSEGKCDSKFPFGEMDSYITQYTAISDTSETSPGNWQSQLQAGPIGNLNNGGIYRNDRDFRYSFLKDQSANPKPLFMDNSGYEWAGIFEHSAPSGHAFNLLSGSKIGDRNGFFGNYSTSNGWETVWGGNNGSYLKSVMTTIPDSSQKTSFTWVISKNKPHAAGVYDVYMTYIASGNNADSVLFAYGTRDVKRLNKTGIIDQTKESGGWKKITVDDSLVLNDNEPFYLRISNTNWGIFDASRAINSPWHGGDVIVDAIKIVNRTTKQEIIVDNDDPENLSSNENRYFINMFNDGGKSLVPFIISNGCNTHDINAENNIGLLYGMIYEGLISIGSSTVHTNEGTRIQLLSQLNRNISFGNSFLTSANALYSNSTHFIVDELIGAGSLKPKARFRFNKNLTSSTITQTDPHILEHSTANLGIVYTDTTSHGISLYPEFTAKLGSELRFKAK